MQRHHLFNGSARTDDAAFDALLSLPTGGADAQAVHDYAKRIPEDLETLKRAFKRDALTRCAMARGRLPEHMLGDDKFAGMVHLSEIARFAGAIPADDPCRIKIVRPESPLFEKMGSHVADVSPNVGDDFLRYTRHVYEATPTRPAPFVRSPGRKDPVSGIVHAGGSVLNEVLLTESARKPVRLASVTDDGDVEQDVFRLKGGASDKDTFIVVQVKGDGSDAKYVNAKTAAQIARQTVDAVDPERFINKDSVCGACDSHLRVLPSKRCKDCGACYHVECLEDAQDQMELPRDTCPSCKGVLAFRNVSPTDGTEPGISMSRCTVNLQTHVSEGGEDAPAALKTVFQLTGRVYFDHRQVVSGFDIAPSQVYYDGVDVWATEMGALSIANGVLPLTPFAMSNTAEFRILKYVIRYGLDLYVPGLTQAAYDQIRPAPVRGIAGIKWLLLRVEGEKKSLDHAWWLFAREVGKMQKALLVLAGGIPDFLPATHMTWARSARPYVASFANCIESLADSEINQHDSSAMAERLEESVRERRERYGEASAEQHARDLVKRTDLPMRVRAILNKKLNTNVPIGDLHDYLALMRYHTVDPGAQTFFQAQFERYKRGRRGNADDSISAISCYPLWTTDPRNF